MEDAEKRQFPRLQAPVYCTPVGLRIFEGRRQVNNISIGGIRVYSDNSMKVGMRLEIELFLPDSSSVVCQVEVVWIDKLPADGPARFDVGLKFTDLNPGDEDRLSTVLAPQS